MIIARKSYFNHIRYQVNVVVIERYSFVYLHFHHVSKHVKRGCQGMIIARLLTFS